MTDKKLKSLHPFVQERVKREEAVVKGVAEALFAKGYTIAVDFGEYEIVPLPNGGYREEREQGPVRRCWRMLRRDLGAAEVEHLFVFAPGKTCLMDSPDGVVTLVWGNDTDVVANYTVNMEEFAKAGYEIAERIDEEKTRNPIQKIINIGRKTK